MSYPSEGQRRRCHFLGTWLALVWIVGTWFGLLAVASASTASLSYTEEEYNDVVLLRRLNSLAQVLGEKRKLAVELEQAERLLVSAQNQSKVPDSKMADFGNTVRVISNAQLREEGAIKAKKIVEQIEGIKKQQAIVAAREVEFQRARERGFIPIRNTAGQESQVSPVGFRGGAILFIAQDMVFYVFPIDDLQYASLLEAVRFLDKHAGDSRHLLDDVAKLSEKSFFEKLASLDFSINVTKPQGYGQFVAVKAVASGVDPAVLAAQLAELKSEAETLQKLEGALVLAVQWDVLESEAEKVSSPTLHWVLAERYLQSGKEGGLEKARQWAERAARQGYAPAYVTLGNLYNEGYLLQVGFAKDTLRGTNYEQARQWYERAAGEREPGGFWGLGKLYFWGLGVPSDEKKGAEYFRETTQFPDKVYAPQACFMMGILYYQGRGVEKDHDRSIRWMEACANMNPGSALALRAKGFIAKNAFEVAKR